MKKTKIVRILKSSIFTIEIFISLILLFSIVIGLISSVISTPEILKFNNTEFYPQFKLFLANIFLLIVGVELIRMLATHTMKSTLELMVFVVARKMLIYTDSMFEIILGTIALGIIFSIMKFLIPNNLFIKKIKDIYSGTTKISDINNFTDLTIYGGENLTLNEYLKKVLPRDKIKPGAIFDAGTLKMKILSIYDDEINYIEILEDNLIDEVE